MDRTNDLLPQVSDVFLTVIASTELSLVRSSQ